MKKTLPLLLVFSLVLMSFPAISFAAETVEDPYEAFLRLGKPKPGVDQVVGGLQIWNDAETLFVQFEADEPFCISALHLHVANDLSDVPQMGGMILPGSAFNEDYDDCLPVRGPFEFNLIENGWNAGSNLVIAAHADIGELICNEKCVTVEEFFYPPSDVDSYQGWTYEGKVISEEYTDNRWNEVWVIDEANPDNPLQPYIDDLFFSLGLIFPEENPDNPPEKFGGWVTVEFDNPITNGEGYDVWIVEETEGEYALEAAKVEASNDNANWVDLGWIANYYLVPDPLCPRPSTLGPNKTVSCVDLDGKGLDSARYIRITDYFCDEIDEKNDPESPCSTKPREEDPEDIWDGFDVSSIWSMQDYVECTQVCEDCYLGRAWAGNKIGSGAAWSRWVRYLVTGEGAVQDNGILTVLDTPEEIAAPAANMNDGAARQQIFRGR